MIDSRFLKLFGWIATATSMAMYISYIPQIKSNLSGDKGDWFQPLVAAINCTLWVSYGLLKPKKDWPLAIASIPGIIFGLFAFLTAL